MDHEGCSSGAMSAPTTYTFAFNDSNFSDRMLRIEVVAVSEKNDGDSTSARQKKRRRADRNTEAGSLRFVCLFRVCIPFFPPFTVTREWILLDVSAMDKCTCYQVG